MEHADKINQLQLLPRYLEVLDYVIVIVQKLLLSRLLVEQAYNR